MWFLIFIFKQEQKYFCFRFEDHFLLALFVIIIFLFFLDETFYQKILSTLLILNQI